MQFRRNFSAIVVQLFINGKPPLLKIFGKIYIFYRLASHFWRFYENIWIVEARILWNFWQMNSLLIRWFFLKFVSIRELQTPPRPLAKPLEDFFLEVLPNSNLAWVLLKISTKLDFPTSFFPTTSKYLIISENLNF